MNKSVSIIYAAEDHSFAELLNKQIQRGGEIASQLEPLESLVSLRKLEDYILVIISPRIKEPSRLCQIIESSQRDEEHVLFILIQSISLNLWKQLRIGCNIVDLRLDFMKRPECVIGWLKAEQTHFCSSPTSQGPILFDKSVPSEVRYLTTFFIVLGLIGSVISLTISLDIIRNIFLYSQPLENFLQIFEPIFLIISIFIFVTNAGLVIGGFRYYSRSPSRFLDIIKEYRSLHITIGLSFFLIFCCGLISSLVNTNDYHTYIPLGLIVYALLGFVAGAYGMKWFPGLFEKESTVTLWYVPLGASSHKENQFFTIPEKFPKIICILYDSHDEPFAKLLGEELENRGRVVKKNCEEDVSDYYLILSSRWLLKNQELENIYSSVIVQKCRVLVVRLENTELPVDLRNVNAIYADIDVYSSLKCIFKFLSNDLELTKSVLMESSKNHRYPTFYSRTDMFMFFLWVFNAVFSFVWFPILCWYSKMISICLILAGFLLVLGAIFQYLILQTSTAGDRRISLPVYLIVNISETIGVIIIMMTTRGYQFSILPNSYIFTFIFLLQVIFLFLALLQIRLLSYWLPAGFVFRFPANLDVGISFFAIAVSIYLPALAWRLLGQ